MLLLTREYKGGRQINPCGPVVEDVKLVIVNVSGSSLPPEVRVGPKITKETRKIYLLLSFEYSLFKAPARKEWGFFSGKIFFHEV